MEIILIRHGQPTFELKGKASSREISGIIENYNQSGITGEPGSKAKQIALECDVVVCSDFKRSIQSAQLLGFKDIHFCDPVFREVALPHFRIGEFVMPLRSWGFLFRFMSLFGFSRNGESLSMAKARAKMATSQLIGIVQNHRRVLFVGHGVINYFIARELLSRKWIGPSRPGSSYWDVSVYSFTVEFENPLYLTKN